MQSWWKLTELNIIPLDAILVENDGIEYYPVGDAILVEKLTELNIIPLGCNLGGKMEFLFCMP